MNRRLLAITLTIMLVIGGLVAGLFSGPIQKALTTQMTNMNTMGKTAAQGQASPALPGKGTQQANPTKTPNAGNMQNITAPAQTNVLAQDTFQRTDQLFWGQASDGRKWQGDANTLKVFSIVGATGQIANGQSTVNAVLGPVSDNANALLSGSVNQFGNGVNLGVVLRWTNGQNWYKALIDGEHLSILKRVNGQSTQVRTVPFQAQDGKIYNIRFQAIGAMLFAKVWRNDLPEPARWMITLSDPDLKNGQAGLRVVLQPTTVMSITSFQAVPATMGNDL
ncbi:hypothetical protein [Dictyobacter formicarum]|uniref:PA14 domain-containing protein n=1 Tax=Dictyobacter formicarum TaxID=2778368 RepID=A0ABQ3V9F7_9CHLR|nr:hypothetical protein [Dictyobacter formicarum]GHO82053.1 hypothetical protein KSZ_00590 [Dictyobacter formicarum]